MEGTPGATAGEGSQGAAPLTLQTPTDTKKLDAAKIKENLEKLRGNMKKTLSAHDGNQTPLSTPNDARKQLASWRAKTRDRSESVGSDGARAGRQGPRSPLRSTSKRNLNKSTPGVTPGRSRGRTFSDGDQEEYDDEEEEGAEEEEEEEYEYTPIMQIIPAHWAFPLSILPKSRVVENKMQVMQIMPAPPTLPPACLRAANTLCACACVDCCDRGSLFERLSVDANTMHERDFLRGSAHHSLLKWLDAQDPTPLSIRRHAQSAGADGGEQPERRGLNREAGGGVGSGGGSGREREEADEYEALLDMKSDRLDGLYGAAPPTLAHVLLASEAVPNSIARITAPHLRLSRATQRLLRDLRGSLEIGRQRRRWQTLKATPMVDEGVPRGIAEEDEENDSPGGERGERPEEVGEEEEEGGYVPPEVYLLRELQSAPMLQVVENPVVGGATQPRIPRPNLAYGGQIGQWGLDATATERLGPMPRGFSSRKGHQRAIFRLHLHQLLFSDHPLMCPEEKQLSYLKEIYAQYRSLFEQKILEFLTQRLFALTSRLAEYTSGTYPREKTLTSEETDELKALYRDLVETLPALNELNVAVDNLSCNVYRAWRGLQDLRRIAGASYTSADLSVRRVRSNLSAPPPRRGRGARETGAGAGGSEADDGQVEEQEAGEEAGGQMWVQLQKLLSDTPSMLSRAQSILYRDDAVGGVGDSVDMDAVEGAGSQGQSEGQGLGSGSEVGSQAGMRKTEEQRAKRTALDRVLVVVSDAVKELLDSHGLIPQFALRLTEDAPTCPDPPPPAEAKRRLLLKDVKIKAILRINGRAVTSTDYLPLKPRQALCVDFNRFFELRVLNQPQDVVIDLYSKKSHSWDTFLASVPIPFPGQASQVSAPEGDAGRHQHVSHSYTPNAGWYHFTSDAKYDAGVGGAGGLSRTAGAVLVTTEFDVSAENGGNAVRTDEVALLPLPKQSSASATRQRRAASDFTRENDFQAILPDLAEIDVNDPDNDHLLYLKSKRAMLNSAATFRLAGHDFSTVFNTDEGLPFSNYVRYKEAPRMKLLQLRNIKPYLFNEPIPLNESLIKSSEVYRAIFVNELHETMARIGGKEEEEKTITGKVSVNAAKVSNFLLRVRSSNVAQSRQKQRKNFITSSVVVETNFFQSDEVEFVNVFERRRDLHPRTKNRAPMSVQVDKCELLVQIVGAKNIPLRVEHDGMANIPRRNRATSNVGVGADAGAGADVGSPLRPAQQRPRGLSNADDPDHPVVSEHMLDDKKMRERRRACTFIEVRFQENTVATAAMEGAAPMWRESIALPFKAPQDDFSPASLEQVRENVYFTLFDEVQEDDSDRGGLLEGESPIRLEKRFLGSFCVPFETIYSEGRIEGVFRIDTPALNFGYDHISSSARTQNKQSSNLFEGDEEEKEEAVVSPLWSTLVRMMECLSQTSVLRPNPHDSLYSNFSFVHAETQKEFSYFVTDDHATYLKVMITLDPLLLTTPEVPMEITVGNVITEDRGIAAYARRWVKSIKALGPRTAERNYKLFGTNSTGMNVFLCRFLTPQAPPPGYDSRRSVLHLISTIPFMKDGQSFLGEMDLWCTCSQFWEIGAGDEEEHAVTLFNYLLYLSLKQKSALGTGGATGGGAPVASGDGTALSRRKSSDSGENMFLVMGKAVPEGETVYVMLRDEKRSSAGSMWGPQHFLIINPWTGYVYSALDSNCPLRDVYLLATPNNVWANLQVQSRPTEMNFDVTNPDCWRPFFGTRYPLPQGGLNTVQTEIEYIETSPGYALEIEKSIFQSLRNNIRKWRSKRHRSTTTFHPDGCAVMHDLLPKLENWKRSGNPDSDEGQTSDLKTDQTAAVAELQRLAHDRMKHILRTRKLMGFPINMPFTDVEEVLTRVKTMCVHESKHPEVQFVMAVRAFPLYNNILSLWIFLGTLEPTGA